jgi:hypothetical protein
MVEASVVDPDPLDPYVFPFKFYHQSKIVRNTLTPNVL